MELNEREKLVLSAIIDHYLNYGETIGSRTLVKKYDLELSSATIRNVMADLEDLGFITKTHSSSGRVPTDMGYKYYVKTLLQIQKLSKDQKRKIDLAYEKRNSELEDILESTSRLLSKLSSYAGVAIEPVTDSERVKKIEIVYINSHLLMAVIIMENSSVKTKKIYLKIAINEEETKELSTVLNDRIKSEKNIAIHTNIEKIINEEINEMVDEVSKECFKDIEGEFYFEGTPNIITNLSKDNTEEMINVIKFFEGKKELRNIFSDIVQNVNFEEGKVNVVLGDELNIKEVENLSFVFSVYNLGKSKGVIGIVGPKRMEYSKTVGLVEYVTNEVNKAIGKIGTSEET